MQSARLATALLFSLIASACTPEGNPNPTGTGGAGTGGGAGGRGGTGGRGGGGAGGATSSGGTTGGSTAGGSGGGGAGGSGGSGTTDAATDTAGEGGSAACSGAAATTLLCDPLRKMPMSIKDTGIFVSPPDLSMVPPRVKEYYPTPELWSDGLHKQRFILMPDGQKIDNTNRKNWIFPKGTIFIKTFFDDGGAGGKTRAVETRFIRSEGDPPYGYYLYRWNADGTDATLLVDDIKGVNGDPNVDTPTPITIKRMVNGQLFQINNGQPFMHALPSRDACGKCHDENGMVGQTFIGFDELRLNNNFKSTTKTQLQEFGEAQLFKNPIPTDPVSLPNSTTNDQAGRLARIKRFIFGNCVHCHNEGLGQFDLSPAKFEANTINQMTEAQSVVPPADWRRVVPRDPGKSVVYKQVERTMLPTMVGGVMTRLRPMPPPPAIADIAVDQAALTDLRLWIMNLPPQ